MKVLKVLVLGANGMLGSAMMRELARTPNIECIGTVRLPSTALLTLEKTARFIANIDVTKIEQLESVFDQVQPHVVINCIGLVKQDPASEDPLMAISINALLPHQLAALCQKGGARLIHLSTDCVFSGDRGNYVESDFADASDLYGRSKYLGEVKDPHALTIRTSIIGHELAGTQGLLEWFLSQQERCKGYTRAIFSGLPTTVLAKLICEKVLPNTGLSGVYHVSSNPISKYNLLKLIASEYGKSIEIVPSEELVIDRSLNSERFSKAVQWVAPSWESMVKEMHIDKVQYVQK